MHDDPVIASPRIVLASLAALLACTAAACDSKGGGSSCFAPADGPDGPSCSAYDEGLTCPVGVSPFYTCVCTSKTWVCTPAGATTSSGGTGGAGTGGASGTGGTGGTNGTGGH